MKDFLKHTLASFTRAEEFARIKPQSLPSTARSTGSVRKTVQLTRSRKSCPAWTGRLGLPMSSWRFTCMRYHALYASARCPSGIHRLRRIQWPPGSIKDSAISLVYAKASKTAVLQRSHSGQDLWQHCTALTCLPQHVPKQEASRRTGAWLMQAKVVAPTAPPLPRRTFFTPRQEMPFV